MVLDGVPFAEEILMWWNFVARSRDEIDAADRSWQLDDGRFGAVANSLGRIQASQPLAALLRERGRRVSAGGRRTSCRRISALVRQPVPSAA
jgi:hypothetical protein